MSRTAKYGMEDEMDTPLTDAAAIGFARILVKVGTPDNPKFETTEIIPSDFARRLERSHAELVGDIEKWRLLVLRGWDENDLSLINIVTEEMHAALAKAKEIGT